MRTITLLVRDDFKDPCNFELTSPEENELILLSGASCRSFVQQNISVQISDAEFNRQIAYYRAELAKKDKAIDIAREPCLIEIQQLKDKYEALLDKYEAALSVHNREVITMNSKYAELVESTKISKVAVMRGIIGENHVYEYLSKRFNMEECCTEMKAKTPNAGDMWVTIRGLKILVEIKNKKYNTPGDIDKFVSNTLMSPVHAGLYISLEESAIPNHGSFSIDLKYPKPMIYMYYVCDELIYNAIQMLCKLSERSSEDQDAIYTQMKSVIQQLEDNIQDTVQMVENNIKMSHTLSSSLERMRLMVVDQAKLITDLYLDYPSVKISEIKCSVLPLKIIEAIVDKYQAAGRPLADAEIYSASGKSQRYIVICGGINEIKRRILTDMKYNAVHKFVSDSISVPAIGFDLDTCNKLYSTNQHFQRLIGIMFNLMQAGNANFTAESLSVYNIPGITKTANSYKTTFGVTITHIKQYVRMIYENNRGNLNLNQA